MPWTLDAQARGNWLEKFNEWKTAFDKNDRLVLEETQAHRGAPWKVTPKLDGVELSDCVGTGPGKPEAKNAACKLLSDKGKLWR